ncbi:efflux RND transporter periplasmic adaptor subunit [Gaopeijia maritima]|uniref:Efflux RND transporter periplasmic adaptor subunit n=1 Tax=Gaopeijia maritima TaxID=3119007 RepID=A0ABU9ED41_9BACT
MIPHIRGRVALAALTTVAVLSACGGSDESAAAGGPGGRGGPGGFGGGGQASPVETAVVVEGDISRVVVLPGTVEPIRTVGVNAQVAGALLELSVEEGDRVEEGQVVARLDDRELQAQLRSAEASFEVAEASFDRARQLLERQVITQPEYEAERTGFEAARAQLEQLRTRVGFTEVRAPIGGVVTTKLMQTGDVVGNQGRLLEVAEVDTMVVRVSVSELDIVQIEEGDAVDVTLDALPDDVLQATVRRVFPAADPTTRLIPVEVALSSADGRRARPGFLARVSFQLDPKPNARLIPASAIVSRGGGEGVYLVSDSTVVLRSVTPGLTAGGQIEIVDGLAVGDRVVTLGANLLRDGGRIRDVTGQRAAVGAEVDTFGSPAQEGGQ